MTILLNYRPVLRQPTGIGIYANAILPTLQQLPHVLVAGGEVGTARQRLTRLAWTQLCLPKLARRSQASLIFTPAPEGYLGVQRIPQVVMVHDLRPMSHPELSLQSVYFRAWVPALLRACLHVLTNSHYTAREIMRCTGLPEHRCTVIPLGYDSSLFKPAELLSVPPKDPYLLHVGQAYPHKNLRRLIQAFARIAPRHPEVRLVLVGKPHPTETPQLQALVDQLAVHRQVEFRSYVSSAALPDLYRGALGLVFPSLWEGFGLPVLEAFACGTPVITSLGSGTEELAGNAALLVDPIQDLQISEAMEALIVQPSLRAALSNAGLERATSYRWQTCCSAHRMFFEGIAKGSGTTR